MRELLTGTPFLAILAAILAFGVLGYMTGELLVNWRRARVWKGRGQ